MACTEKQKEYARKWYHANKERLKESRRQYHLKNRERIIQRVKDWNSKNRERKNAWSRATWKKYFKPETRKAWNEKNKDRLRAMERERYKTQDKYRTLNVVKAAARRRAICSWANFDKVAAIYAEARRLSKETGTEHVVDHIVPIKHKLVCGLTNEFNLQVIPDSENAKKRNKFSIEALNA